MACVEENFRDLEDEPNTRRLINCVVLLNHMLDWVWHGWLEHDAARCQLLGLAPTPPRTTLEFKSWIEGTCNKVKIIREVANGAKHLRAPKERTPTDTGYQMTGMMGFTEACWWIEWNGKMENIYSRAQDAGTALHDTLKFWRDFQRQHATWA
jgi:hypothetical protein